VNSLKIVPPSEVAPVLPGFVRHQFVLTVTDKDVKEGRKTNADYVSYLLVEYFGTNALYAEKVMEGEIHAWHLWLDYPEGEFEKLMQENG
jgi:hypothetical protein